MSDWLDSALEQRLEKIRSRVSDAIRGKGEAGWMTGHTEAHFRDVEEQMKSLIADPNLLSPANRFLLLASAWLHDIGMIVGLETATENREQVRHIHHERSQRYVRENSDALGLGAEEALQLGEMCLFHRRRMPIREVKDDTLRLLTAYLRIADAVALSRLGRGDDRQYRRLVDLGMPLTSKLHWLKSLYVSSIRPVPEEHRIVVTLDCPSADKKYFEELAEIICREIQEELYLVQDVIVRGGLPMYLDVVADVRPHQDQQPASYALDLQQVLGNLKLNEGTASEVANTLINTILNIVDKAESRQEAYKAVREYRIGAVEPTCETRSCHYLLQKILKVIEGHTRQELEEVQEVDAVVSTLQGDLRNLLSKRREKTAKVIEHARPFLVDGGAILLYSISSLIIRALAGLEDEIKRRTEIFVLECRSKTRMDIKGETIYCDGEKYASALADAGFERVHLIPDLAAANLMARRRVTKVLIGANGIDLETGLMGHTAGHRAVADLAKVYGIPLYVFADGDKFGKFKEKESRRTEGWLMDDRLSMRRLGERGITLFNPREDSVRPEQVAVFITDRGAVSSLMIRERFGGK